MLLPKRLPLKCDIRCPNIVKPKKEIKDILLQACLSKSGSGPREHKTQNWFEMLNSGPSRSRSFIKVSFSIEKLDVQKLCRFLLFFSIEKQGVIVLLDRDHAGEGLLWFLPRPLLQSISRLPHIIDSLLFWTQNPSHTLRLSWNTKTRNKRYNHSKHATKVYKAMRKRLVI